LIKVLFFSGGKDSLACLYLYRNDPDVVVVYVDTGAAFPHMPGYICETVERLGMRLFVARPDTPCAQWQAENGFPADVVPWKYTPEMAWTVPGIGPTRVIPVMTCCQRNLWGPSMQAVKDLEASVVIRGSKACDHKVGVPDGYVENGVTFVSPLWNWSENEVLSYLDSVGAVLPPQYEEGGDSLDCWNCTAHMDIGGPGRFAYLKRHYPDLYKIAKSNLDTVRGAIAEALSATMMEV
jgi:phosphoadenosine phosphosulfate reductase